MALQELEGGFIEEELMAMGSDVDPAIAEDVVKGDAAGLPIDPSDPSGERRTRPDSVINANATAGAGEPASPAGSDLQQASDKSGPFEAPPDARSVRVDADDYRKARRRHNRRSMQSQENDEARRAELTTDYDKWKKKPGELDFPGVDSVKEIVPDF